MSRCEEEHCRRGDGTTKALEGTGHGVFQNRDGVIKTRSRMRGVKARDLDVILCITGVTWGFARRRALFRRVHFPRASPVLSVL